MITLCTTKLLAKKTHAFLTYKKEKMLSLFTKERKAQWSIAVKEFNNESLNLVTIQNKMEKKNCSIDEQQVPEIDALYDDLS